MMIVFILELVLALANSVLFFELRGKNRKYRWAILLNSTVFFGLSAFEIIKQF